MDVRSKYRLGIVAGFVKYVFLLSPRKLDLQIVILTTLPDTNIAPENRWLEYYFPFGKVYFQGIC